ncbi:hypothetical protein GQ600_694 [Phytophthora cactorum]|nr:hypothetical protein GQ600_694 [Phytophthora cactorum]
MRSRCPAKHGLWRRQCAHERRQLSLKSRKSVAILMEVIAVDIHPIFPIKAPFRMTRPCCEQFSNETPSHFTE